MQSRRFLVLTVVLLASLSLNNGCGKNADNSAVIAALQRHEHKPPHGGTPVVLGDEAYHVELVLDAASGNLQAYVLDGEMEGFIRLPAPSVEFEMRVNGVPQILVLRAVANPATGETISDTAMFEAQAEWLKTAREFDGTLQSITIHGTTFTEVKFNFPKGNDRD